MDALYQNALLYAIGWAILHSFWQMALAWMAFQMLFGFRRKTGPELRYMGAVTLLGTGGVLFLLTALYEYRNAMAMGPLLRVLVHENGSAATPAGWSSLLDSLSILLERFMPYLSAAYLIVLFFLAARLWSAWLQTRDIRSNGLTPLDEPWIDEVRGIAEKLGLGQIGIFLSDRVQVPVTLGHLRPLILLPVATLNYLTIDQARAVLLHEIAHIRRRDYLVNIGVSVIGTLLFFNPFVHVLSASLRRDREMCCDDFVLQCRQDAGDYARALMSLEQFRSGLSPAMVMAATGQKGQLLNRVKRILDINNGRVGYGQRLVAFLFLAGLLSTLAWMAPDAISGPFATPSSVGATVAKKQSGDMLQLSMAGSSKALASLVPELGGTKVKEARGVAEDDQHPVAVVDREHPAAPALLAPDMPIFPPAEAFARVNMDLRPFLMQPDKFTVFDESVAGAAFQPFEIEVKEPDSDVELSKLVYINADGQRLTNMMVSAEVKAQLDASLKQIKGFRMQERDINERRAMLAQAQQLLSQANKERLRQQRDGSWQKKMMELTELNRALHPEQALMPDQMFEVPVPPDPEEPVRAKAPRTNLRFTFQGGARMQGMRSETIAGDRAPKGTHSFSFAGTAPVVNGAPMSSEQPARVARSTNGANIVSTGTNDKGVRIIVVEQDPRNIEIRLERD